MASKILNTPLDGTPKQIVFADHDTDFSPTATSDLRITDDGSMELEVQFDLTDVANDACRQSDKFDFGAHWASAYAVQGALEFAASGLTAGNTVSLYFGFKSINSDANANPGGCSGSDGAYTGYAGSTAAQSVVHLTGPFRGIVSADSTGTIQIIDFGILYVPQRYGVLVFGNTSGAAMHSDAVESHIVLTPIVPESQ